MPKKKFEVQDAIKASRETTDMLLRMLEFKTSEQVSASMMFDAVIAKIKVLEYHLYKQTPNPSHVKAENIEQFYGDRNDGSVMYRLENLEETEGEVGLEITRRFEDLEREVTQLAAKLDSFIKKRPARPLKKSQG
jgi:SMC interacting uncharacterized protein involved in chromosome segregation